MKAPKLRELREAITALIRGPYTSRFPKEASVPPERFRGKPEFVLEECVGCVACSELCPANAIQVQDIVTGPQSGRRVITLHYDHCIFCATCERGCLTGEGIHLTQQYDLATYDRTLAVETIEKDLALCEHCGSPVTTQDHLRWLARHMGAKVYSNPGLMLALHQDLGMVGETSPRDDRPLGRADHVRFLCPNCRREVVFTEEWG